MVAQLAWRRVGFGHFARHHAGGRHGQVKQKVRIDAVEADAQGVFVQRLQARDRRVIAEIFLQRRVAHQFIFQQKQPRRLQRRIVQPHQAVHIILRRHFARLALEGRIGRKEDAGLDLESVGQAAILDLRQAARRIALQLDRARQVVVAQQRVEHVFHQVQAGQVGRHGRVQAGFAGAQEQVQGLAGAHRWRIGGGMGGVANKVNNARPAAQAVLRKNIISDPVQVKAGIGQTTRASPSTPMKTGGQLITFWHAEAAFFHQRAARCLYTLLAGIFLVFRTYLRTDHPWHLITSGPAFSL